MVAWLATIAALATCAVAEYLHLRRVRKVAYLAFGPAAKPRRWVAAAPLLRALGVGAVCWGLVILVQIESALWEADDSATEARQRIHHLVVALDVSPSMQLEDAGPQDGQARAERAREVLRSILDRLNLRRTRVSLVAFYTEARPVVVDTFDRNVVSNILDDLPLEHAFQAGKTNMYEGVEVASEIARAWPPRSASFVLLSDGDTLPAEQTPYLPAAFAGRLVIGVGNPYRGQFIDGHSSRQDAHSLNRLALRLGGVYYDANTRHVPTPQIVKLEASLPIADRGVVELRDVAIWAVLGGAIVLALLGPALATAGSAWNPQRATCEEAFVWQMKPQLRGTS